MVSLLLGKLRIEPYECSFDLIIRSVFIIHKFTTYLDLHKDICDRMIILKCHNNP